MFHCNQNDAPPGLAVYVLVVPVVSNDGSAVTVPRRVNISQRHSCGPGDISHRPKTEVLCVLCVVMLYVKLSGLWSVLSRSALCLSYFVLI